MKNILQAYRIRGQKPRKHDTQTTIRYYPEYRVNDRWHQFENAFENPIHFATEAEARGAIIAQANNVRDYKVSQISALQDEIAHYVKCENKATLVIED